MGFRVEWGLTLCALKCKAFRSFQGILGGSRVIISGVISRVTVVITHTGGLIAPLRTTHEPPSRHFRGVLGFGAFELRSTQLRVLGWRFLASASG